VNKQDVRSTRHATKQYARLPNIRAPQIPESAAFNVSESGEAFMPQDLELTIRERAYHLWVAEGCRDGESDRHWLAAEREVLAAFATTAPTSKGRSRRAANSNVDAAAKEPAKAASKPPAKARRRA
jgi:hypothetical protein